MREMGFMEKLLDGVEVEWTAINEVMNMRAGQHISASNINDYPDDEYQYPCFGGNGVRGFVKSALKLAPLLFQRPGELRGAKWEEINFDESMWTIPAQRMKRGVHGKEYGDPHFVPLSKQALEIFKNLRLYTGASAFCFPSPKSKDRCISENSPESVTIPPAPSTAPINIPRCLPTAPPIDANDAQSQ